MRPNRKVAFIVGILLSCFLAAAATAQMGAGQRHGPGRRAEVRERVEMLRIWKLTEALQLDPDKAELFFPRYRKHLAELDSLHEELRDTGLRIERGLRDEEDVDFAGLIQRAVQLQRMETEQLVRFIDANSDLLSERQQAALLIFEHRFNQRLRELAHRVGDRPPGEGPPPGRRDPWGPRGGP